MEWKLMQPVNWRGAYIPVGDTENKTIDPASKQHWRQWHVPRRKSIQCGTPSRAKDSLLEGVGEELCGVNHGSWHRKERSQLLDSQSGAMSQRKEQVQRALNREALGLPGVLWRPAQLSYWEVYVSLRGRQGLTAPGSRSLDFTPSAMRSQNRFH